MFERTIGAYCMAVDRIKLVLAPIIEKQEL